MLTVVICGLINSGLLLGLLAGLVVGFASARGRIAKAFAYDPFESRVTPVLSAAAPA